ncbi:glycerate kinase family protein [Bifidobacterium criceti]|uniref:Glycerate kinase n=1 Tax=Bifidobacterium criceti TaxID=1960969 RepID=A0A2A2EDD7_9BIFI|nr:glycerate kinase [Bifidobacterium criceti]PAU67033.1 glycerate kinase [Bifidobacterium criceti]
MRIVIAPDSFKGCMTAAEAAAAIEEGMRRALPDADYVAVPMADGGEGTVQALVDATGGRLAPAVVTGPLGTPVAAVYGMLGDRDGGRTAVIEMASAAGLGLVDVASRDARVTTTFGVGELIRDALDHGATSFIIGLGGSATNDGGAGMMQALGVHLRDAHGNELGYGGAALAQLASIDVSGLDPRVKAATFILASDVTNPLTGPCGASSVFGPQKGADAMAVAELDTALRRWAAVIRDTLGRDVEHVPGAGAAGGLGAGFLACTDARMRPGVSIVAEATGLSARAYGADLCVTGEGCIDGQTRYGKTPVGVARIVKDAAPGCTVVALAGCVGHGADTLQDHGIDAVFGIMSGPVSLTQAIGEGRANLVRTAENVARLVAAIRIPHRHAPRPSISA